MAVWKKVVLVALVAVVGLVPAFAQLSYAQAAPVQQASVTLPQGRELGDEELLDTEGELWLTLLLGFCFGAGLAAWHEYYRDEDRGVDWDDAPEIVLGWVGMAGGVLLGYYAY